MPGSLLLSACLRLLFPSFVLELSFSIDAVINLMGGEVSAVFKMLAHSPRADFRVHVFCFVKRA
eukprot:scaffold41740_cov28-Attheya_sp.AAC.1